jgi:hypothetical protein
MFSQDDMTRVATREKEQGHQAAINEIAARLGMSVEDAEKRLTEAKEREDKEKSELDRLREENEATKAASASAVSTVQQELHIERVKAQLLKAKVPLPEDETKVDAALDRLVALVKAQPGASAEDIRADIDELKVELPQVFSVQTAPGTPSSMPSGTPTRTPASGETVSERAARIAQESNKARGVVTPTA